MQCNLAKVCTIIKLFRAWLDWISHVVHANEGDAAVGFVLTPQGHEIIVSQLQEIRQNLVMYRGTMQGGGQPADICHSNRIRAIRRLKIRNPE